ncbi:hypothetical protein TRVL_09704 [Trypanosoma vivax]|nr:hypothetical protein TRVL_09704 [Trypanosoma vivax]
MATVTHVGNRDVLSCTPTESASPFAGVNVFLHIRNRGGAPKDRTKHNVKRALRSLGALLTLSECTADLIVFHCGNEAVLATAAALGKTVVTPAYLYECAAKMTRLPVDGFVIHPTGAENSAALSVPVVKESCGNRTEENGMPETASKPTGKSEPLKSKAKLGTLKQTTLKKFMCAQEETKARQGILTGMLTLLSTLSSVPYLDVPKCEVVNVDEDEPEVLLDPSDDGDRERREASNSLVVSDEDIPYLFRGDFLNRSTPKAAAAPLEPAVPNVCARSTLPRTEACRCRSPSFSPVRSRGLSRKLPEKVDRTLLVTDGPEIDLIEDTDSFISSYSKLVTDTVAVAGGKRAVEGTMTSTPKRSRMDNPVNVVSSLATTNRVFNSEPGDEDADVVMIDSVPESNRAPTRQAESLTSDANTNVTVTPPIPTENRAHRSPRRNLARRNRHRTSVLPTHLRKSHRIAIDGESDESLNLLRDVISQLGATTLTRVFGRVQKPTHMVVGESGELTPAILLAKALGIPVLKSQWVYDAISVGGFPDHGEQYTHPLFGEDNDDKIWANRDGVFTLYDAPRQRHAKKTYEGKEGLVGFLEEDGGPYYRPIFLGMTFYFVSHAPVPQAEQFIELVRILGGAISRSAVCQNLSMMVHLSYGAAIAGAGTGASEADSSSDGRSGRRSSRRRGTDPLALEEDIMVLLEMDDSGLETRPLRKTYPALVPNKQGNRNSSVQVDRSVVIGNESAALQELRDVMDKRKQSGYGSVPVVSVEWLVRCILLGEIIETEPYIIESATPASAFVPVPRHTVPQRREEIHEVEFCLDEDSPLLHRFIASTHKERPQLIPVQEQAFGRRTRAEYIV